MTEQTAALVEDLYANLQGIDNLLGAAILLTAYEELLQQDAELSHLYQECQALSSEQAVDEESKTTPIASFTLG